MSQAPELLVIGTGAAGQTVAHRCADAGRRVAIVDDRPYGGTCALRGCDPKKVLVAAAEAHDWARRMRGRGFACGDARIDWPALQSFKRGFTDDVPEQVESSLREAGIETLHGTARFVDAGTVEVDGRRLRPEAIVLASGAQPMPLDFDGAGHLVDSTAFLELRELPDDLVFVGGGFISFEFAHVAVRAGARVRILEMEERPLGPFDADMVEVLVAAGTDLGISLHTGTRVTRIEQRGDRFRVEAESGEGTRSFETAMVVHGGGRVPRLQALGLDAGGVAHGKGGVEVDERLRSVSNPRVHAAGDAADTGPLLTPVASSQAPVGAANQRGGEQRWDPSAVPAVVFTLPPLASVGLSEAQAREQGIEVEVHRRETSGWYNSRRIGEQHAAHKILTAKDDGRIVGAHLVGHGAEALINLLALAMRSGCSATALGDMLWAYPTEASNLPHML